MRLLVVTQIIDKDDSVLGFFHVWVAALAGGFEHVNVVCLQQGAHALPANTSLYTLGKHKGERTTLVHRIRYALRFVWYAISKSGEYDAVLVHMNQEYVLLAGWFWLLTGKRVYLWRNHYAGSMLTDIAALFCTKIFYTSRHSYTAKFKHAMQMPVGTDAVRDESREPVDRVPRSILSLGRIAPSKNIHVILEALGMLHQDGVQFSATIRGKTEPADEAYRDKLAARARELGIESLVTFGDAVPKNETHLLYRAHEIFVNASPSGMLDKTIFSSMMNGCITIASSDDFKEMADSRCGFAEGDAKDLARTLKNVLSLSVSEKNSLQASLQAVAEAHRLPVLIQRLTEEFTT